MDQDFGYSSRNGNSDLVLVIYVLLQAVLQNAPLNPVAETWITSKLMIVFGATVTKVALTQHSHVQQPRALTQFICVGINLAHIQH